MARCWLAIDRKEFSLSTFIDLARTFDTVDHKILLCELDNITVLEACKLSGLRTILSKDYKVLVVVESPLCSKTLSTAFLIFI